MKLRTIEHLILEQACEGEELRVELTYQFDTVRSCMMWFAKLTEIASGGERYVIPRILFQTKACALEQALRQLELRVTRAAVEGA